MSRSLNTRLARVALARESLCVLIVSSVSHAQSTAEKHLTTYPGGTWELGPAKYGSTIRQIIRPNTAYYSLHAAQYTSAVQGCHECEAHPNANLIEAGREILSSSNFVRNDM